VSLTVYLDTAPLYALLEARDQAHEHAKAIFRKATEAGATLLCPYPAALELHRLLITRKPAQPERAHRTIKAVLSSYSTAMPSEEDEQAALTLLECYPDQKISLTDATIASMVKRTNAKVLTFDCRHFGLLGVEIYL
jgi:predicted nucleic acid-binding protein